MFDLFRSREKSVRILLGVLLGLVALSMLVYLIPGGPSTGGTTGENVVASVGGEKITATDVERQIQGLTRGQSNLPKSILAMYVPTIVNQLIEGKAMAYKAREMGLRISDQELGDTIQAELAGAFGGKFDVKTYQAALAQQGMTVADFENERRDAMLAARLENLETQSLIVSDQDARAEYQRKNLKVGLQYIAFEAKDFNSKVNKDPAAIKAYFDKNRAQFRIPEKRNINLILGNSADFVQSAKISDSELQKEYQDNLDSYRQPERVQVRHILIKTQGKPKEEQPKLKAKAEDLLKQIQHGGNFAERNINLILGNSADFVQSAKISDSELHKEYQDNLDSYRQPERVQVRHILIKTQGKPKEEQPKLKAKAEDLLKQIQHGGNFAELAKKNSEDPGSAEKGGELGFIVRGQTVPNFEKAAFGLKPGETSNVIETEYGYHILQVENKQAAHTQTFDEVRPTLLAEAQKQAGADSLKRATEATRNEIVKTPAQAEAIAKKYNLKFVALNNFANGDQLPDLNAQPELTNALFTAAKGSVTDITPIDNGTKEAIGIVNGITPARNAEFGEVQADVGKRYLETETQRMAQEAAKMAAERARKGESLEAIAKSYGVPVKTAAPFTIDGAAEGIGSGATLAAAFKENVGGIVGPVSGASGQVVCRVSEKIPADMAQFAKNKESIVQNLIQQRQTVQQPLFRDSVVSDLKRRGKIKVNQATLNRIVGAYQG